MTDPIEAMARPVMDALWPILGGNHTDAEEWQAINAAVRGACGQSYQALRETLEPVGWVYSHEEWPSEIGTERWCGGTFDNFIGWTENLLFVLPEIKP